MDLYRAIRELEQEKKRLDGVIGSLEELLVAEAVGDEVPKLKPERSRRGRKDMTPEERLVVAERMRRYWKARRAKPDG